ncbi:putative nuclease HARBI1 [Bienertia sinuspersici]
MARLGVSLRRRKEFKTVGAYFYRSGESISCQFHLCLKAVLKLHVELLKKPKPITEDCDDDRGKYFKYYDYKCLGALDGTMINVNVPLEDQSKYRTRKGTISMNVLGACSPEMEFIYVLPGWEFITPYRGHQYHLKDWNNGPRQPQSAKEYLNLQHAMARNVIERCFGVLKGRWGILRSPSWFSLQTHSRIVLACCLLHNLIKRYMPIGSLEEDLS